MEVSTVRMCSASFKEDLFYGVLLIADVCYGVDLYVMVQKVF